jgi:hypothetical protein
MRILVQNHRCERGKAMRAIVAALALILACTVAGISHGQVPDDSTGPAKPKTYALIAAIGEEFTTVTETTKVGTHLSPYRRTTEKIPDNLLNRFALHSMDKSIAAIDPSSTRIYMSLPAAEVDRVTPAKRDSAAIAAVTAELAKMPQRLAWDRIVVATPAFRALARDGMASKLQGFGVFNEPQCQAGCPTPMRGSSTEAAPLDGVDAVSSDNKTFKAKTYIAPYSYIKVWILDPRTLEILDVQQGFDSRKLAEERHKPAMDVNEWQKYFVGRVLSLIELSVGEAVMRSEINAPKGSVNLGPIKRIDPDEMPPQRPMPPE